jgi:hypothetical protein
MFFLKRRIFCPGNAVQRHSDAGFFSLDAVAALMVFVIMMPALAMLWQSGLDSIRKQAVAGHFMSVQRAAHEYGRLHYPVLMPQVTASSGPVISFVDLQSAGCLPERFENVNAWGQHYIITARLDSNGALAMIVLTAGGREHSPEHPTFANIMVPETAALARAGFIPTGQIGSSGVLRGAYGGWEVSLAGLGLSATPGHLGSISTFTAEDLGQDFLYRVAVPGRPELNAMQVSLDMTGHSINQVGDLAFVPKTYDAAANFCVDSADEGRTFLDAEAGLYLCRDGKTVMITDSGNSLMLKEAQAVANGEIIAKPVCPEGTNQHPEIFVAPSIVSSGAQSPPLSSVQAWATEISADEWQVNLRALNTNNQWVYPAADYGRVVVMTTCARD